MVREKTDFHSMAQEKVKEIWHLYVLNYNPEKLISELCALPVDLTVIGTGHHEIYQGRDAFIAGMEEDRKEAQEIEFEILDEWFSIQDITPDVCIVLGTIWVREKEALRKSVYVEMNSRFSVVCRNTPEGVDLCSIHHSMPYIEQKDGEYYPKTLSALAEEAIKKNHALECRVELDSMTELYNRIYMEHHIAQAMEKEAGVFLMLDLDGFKSINDTVGHLAGDHVIQEFAHLLRNTFGKDAILGRMGGDEFGVWTSHCGHKEAEERFAALQEGCRALSEKMGISFGCSGGLACSKQGRDFVSLYQLADKALYKAKALGKARAEWGGNVKE